MGVLKYFLLGPGAFMDPSERDSGSKTRHLRYYVCDTLGDLPNSGLLPGDIAWIVATGVMYSAISTTAFLAISVGPTGATGPTSQGALVKRTVLTSGTNFTTQPTTTKMLRKLQGGGAGGGGASTVLGMVAGAGGGGGGGYCEVLSAVAGNTAYAYAIGGGGAGGNGATAAYGASGGDTSFTVGSTVSYAYGGEAGSGMAAGVSLLTAIGGVAGNSVDGDVNAAGGVGAFGLRLSTLLAQAGNGGDSVLGGGGRGLNASGKTNGGGYGGGGSGAATAGFFGEFAQNGGAGTAGCIIIEEMT